MSRCKSCDDVMTEDELRKKDNCGRYYDLCFSCIDKYYYEELELDEFEFPEFYKEGRRNAKLGCD